MQTYINPYFTPNLYQPLGISPLTSNPQLQFQISQAQELARLLFLYETSQNSSGSVLIPQALQQGPKLPITSDSSDNEDTDGFSNTSIYPIFNCDSNSHSSNSEEDEEEESLQRHGSLLKEQYYLQAPHPIQNKTIHKKAKTTSCTSSRISYLQNNFNFSEDMVQIDIQDKQMGPISSKKACPQFTVSPLQNKKDEVLTESSMRKTSVKLENQHQILSDIEQQEYQCSQNCSSNSINTCTQEERPNNKNIKSQANTMTVNGLTIRTTIVKKKSQIPKSPKKSKRWSAKKYINTELENIVCGQGISLAYEDEYGLKKKHFFTFSLDFSTMKMFDENDYWGTLVELKVENLNYSVNECLDELVFEYEDSEYYESYTFQNIENPIRVSQLIRGFDMVQQIYDLKQAGKQYKASIEGLD